MSLDIIIGLLMAYAFGAFAAFLIAINPYSCRESEEVLALTILWPIWFVRFVWRGCVMLWKD